MVAEGLHIVGEVLPLVVDGGRRGVALSHIVAALHSVTVERQTGGRRAGTVQAIAEARGYRYMGDEGKVTVDRTGDVETAVLIQPVVAHDHRVVLFTVVELRHTVVVPVLVFQECLTHSLGCLQVLRQGCAEGVGCQRIHHQHRCQQ